MTDEPVEQLIWYVAYGSNLNSSRIACYLQGGQPTGATRTYQGCRDTRLPVADKPWNLPGTVCFAGASTVWGSSPSGAAFYDPSQPGPAIGRGWLLRLEQVIDIITQENNAATGKHDEALARILTSPSIEAGVPHLGAYQRLIRLDSNDQWPAWTLTCGSAPKDLGLRAPSAADAQTIATGLTETTGWDDAQARAYIDSLPGARVTHRPASPLA